MSFEGLQLGRYQLYQKVGSGGMGEVYLAADGRIGRQVAIKVVHGDPVFDLDIEVARRTAQLFEREMKIISQLDHPHILPLYDYGETEIEGTTVTYMVMPYRPEGSLLSWLRQRKGMLLPPQDVATLIEQAASALHHAHERQVIHQDIKPSNFLIRVRPEEPERPDLLLTDFGISRSTRATSNTSQMIQGTPTYMAPEQWEGHPAFASDQYGLAIMAYELLIGQPPFVGKPGPLMYQHLTAPPPAPSSMKPTLPEAVDAVLLQALAKRPEERFVSVVAFASAFQQAISGELPLPSERPLEGTGGLPRFSMRAAERGANSLLMKRNSPDGLAVPEPLPAQLDFPSPFVAPISSPDSPIAPGVVDAAASPLPPTALAPTALAPADHPVPALLPANPVSMEPPALNQSGSRSLQVGSLLPAVLPGMGMVVRSVSSVRSSSRTRWLVIGLALAVVVVGSGLFYAFTAPSVPGQQNTASAQRIAEELVQKGGKASIPVTVASTATARATMTGGKAAQGNAIAQANATSPAASATAQAQATVQAQMTINAQATSQAAVNAQATANAQAKAKADAQAQATATALASKVPLYRLVNNAAGYHFYTTDSAERDNAMNKLGYQSEGITGYVFSTQIDGTVPVYRLASRKNGDHLYTTSTQERDNVANNLGYVYEGIAFYLFPDQVTNSIPLYRSVNLKSNDHFYTASAQERNTATSQDGYRYEQVTGYIFAS